VCVCASHNVSRSIHAHVRRCVPLFRSFLTLLVSFSFSLVNSRVIALDTSGGVIFESTALPGVGAGSPVTNFKGDHILLTHNVDRIKGYLSILFTGALVPGTPLEPVFSGTYEPTDANGTIIERPFSPIGSYLNPILGYYDAGLTNTNDFFMFAWDTPRTATGINDGDGQKFAVQFPSDYLNNGQGLSFFPLGDPTDFHSQTPPVLTNSGLSYYWSVTKSLQDCVVGVEGLARFQFDRNKRTNRYALSRAIKPYEAYQGSRSPPTLSSNPVQPTVYAGLENGL
jgi:hypothetical protein